MAVQEIVPVSKSDDTLIPRIIVAAAVLGLMLAGMCARTYLFVRAKKTA